VGHVYTPVAAGYFDGTVRRTIVHDENLVSHAPFMEDSLQAATDETLAVEDGDDE